MSYLHKYLKYKNKYLNLVKLISNTSPQYGRGDNYSWTLIDNTNIIEINKEDEIELERLYNNAGALELLFKDQIYNILPNGDYVNSNSNKILRREQKITNINDNERTVFEVLKGCAEKNSLIIRVAGGWVRDKILGKENDDIDISIDKASGNEFVNYLFSYIDDLNKISKQWEYSQSHIAATDGKSSELGTATIILKIPNGTKFELDFGRLRSEVYSEDSRVPIIKPASVYEDSLRRDFTINGIFYNINTNKIEDYVGGVKDIHRKIIRTPIDANKSFNDDPLRILRALRFLARFHFSLDNDIIIGMQNSKIKEKFTKLISRERVGNEFIGLFKTGSNPLLAIKQIYNNGLWNNIFGLGLDLNGWTQKSIENSLSLLENLDKMKKMEKSGNLSMESFLATLILPLTESDRVTFYDKLVIKKELRQIINSILKCILAIRELPKDKESWARSQVAFIIRDLGQNNGLFYNAVEIGKLLDTELFDYVKYFVEKEKLINSLDLKPFDAITITQKFGIDKKQLAVLRNILLKWQFDNPEKTLDDALLEKDNILDELSKQEKLKK